MKTHTQEPEISQLADELKTFEAQYPMIRRNVGKHVLIQGKSVVDYFDSYGKAIEAGYTMFGLKGFLVQEINRRSIPVDLRCRFRGSQKTARKNRPRS